jgi:hypothetical protein
MNLTNKQYLAIAIAVLGVLAGSSGQMTEFLGPVLAKSIASGAAFVNAILGSVMAVIVGQSSIVREVEQMPGVEKITVNAQANSTLASLAIDPDRDKIEPARGQETAVNRAATATA